jgi:hypothetical protein
MRIGMTILATSIVVGMAGKIMTCEFASLNVSPSWSESKRVPYSPTGQGPYQQHIFMTQTVSGKTSLPDCVLIPALVAPQVMTKLTMARSRSNVEAADLSRYSLCGASLTLAPFE